MATVQYVPLLPLLSLGKDTARLNPKPSTSPIARTIDLVGHAWIEAFGNGFRHSLGLKLLIENITPWRAIGIP